MFYKNSVRNDHFPEMESKTFMTVDCGYGLTEVSEVVLNGFVRLTELLKEKMQQMKRIIHLLQSENLMLKTS